MSSRRRLSARVARRRALVFDLACGLLLAIVAISVAAGIGVVAVGAVLTLLLCLAWIAIEALVSRLRRHAD